MIMFGVALGISITDFKRLFQNPKILFTGVISQFILLPLVTFIFIKLVNPMPSIALGMMVVAALDVDYLNPLEANKLLKNIENFPSKEFVKRKKKQLVYPYSFSHKTKQCFSFVNLEIHQAKN